MRRIVNFVKECDYAFKAIAGILFIDGCILLILKLAGAYE